jgi:hypothetical protein
VLTLSYVAAWSLFVLGWGTLLAAAFRVRIAKRYRFIRYGLAAMSIAYLWWQDQVPQHDMFSLILATVGLIIAGWVITLKR